MASKNWTANFSMSFLFWFGICESHFSPASLTSCTASAWFRISLARITSLILFSSSWMMLSMSIIGTSVVWFLPPVETSLGSFPAITGFGSPALRRGNLVSVFFFPWVRKSHSEYYYPFLLLKASRFCCVRPKRPYRNFTDNANHGSQGCRHVVCHKQLPFHPQLLRDSPRQPARRGECPS